MSLFATTEYRLRNLQLSSSVEGYLRNLLRDISDLEGLDGGVKILLSDRAWRVTDHRQLASLRAILYDIEDAIEEGLPVVIPAELASAEISNFAINKQANMKQLGNPSEDRIEMSDIYTPERADELRKEESTGEDASWQNMAATTDLHECEVFCSGVDHALKAPVAAALSRDVETPALDNSGYLSNDYSTAQVKQTKINKKEPAGVDAVLQNNGAIDLHDREVIDGGILAHANMAYAQNTKKVRSIVDNEISADKHLNLKTYGAVETFSVLPASLERTVPAAPNISWWRHGTPQKIFDRIPEFPADENADYETCNYTSRLDVIVCPRTIYQIYSWYKAVVAPSRIIEYTEHTVASCRCFQGIFCIGGPRRIGVDFRPPPAPNLNCIRYTSDIKVSSERKNTVISAPLPSKNAVSALNYRFRPCPAPNIDLPCIRRRGRNYH